MIGVLGDYIGRIYEEVKRRPLYIVQDLVNVEADPPSHGHR
jgi:dolichol-phosphate mannosyltransferase